MVGSKLVMATDDEQAVQFEEFRKQFFYFERGMISEEKRKCSDFARIYLSFS